MGAAGDGGPAQTAQRKLTVEEARFYATVYAEARRGCLAELRRRGCTEHEAEEVFASALEEVMKYVNPIERSFAAPQMVNFIKRAAWHCLLKQRNRRSAKSEVDLSEAYALNDASAESPEEAAEEREAVARARDALAALSERDQAIFRQRYQLDLTPEEILERTPGLTLRTYRKIIQRANTRAFAVLERIEGGERCEEMRDPLSRYVAEESPPAERLSVEAHLAHCRACQKAGAQMRGFLLDVASSLTAGSLVLSSRGLARLPSRLLEIPLDGAHQLLGVARAARERLRDLLLRAVGAVPGGGEATVGSAVASTSVKVASVCTAGLAAGACVAAGVIPGVGELVSLGHRTGEPTRERVERPARHSGASPASSLSAPQAAAGAPAPRPAQSKSKRSSRNRRREERERAAAPGPGTAETSPAESTASVRESPAMTGEEFAGSGQPVQAPAASAPSVSTGSAGSGGSAASGAAPKTSASPEFGF